MKIERPRLGGCVFVRPSYVVRRRGDRFFPGTLFQDRHRRPQAAGEPESSCSGHKMMIWILEMEKASSNYPISNLASLSET